MFVSLKIKRTTAIAILISIAVTALGITALAAAIKSEISEKNTKQVKMERLRPLTCGTGKGYCLA